MGFTRTLVALAVPALVVAGCADDGVDVSAATSTTTVATTTIAITSTTSTTMTSTTTTMPTTTTTELIPPESGFYIVDQGQYPRGIAFSVGDFGNVSGDQLGGIGYLLTEGSEILAPFDGSFQAGGTDFIAGETVRAAFLYDESGDILFFIFGNGLGFVEYGPKHRGDVLAVVTNVDANMALLRPVNTLLVLGVFNDSTGLYTPNVELMYEYFSFLRESA